MIARKRALIGLAAGALSLISGAAVAEALTVNVSNLRSAKGIVRCGVFANSKAFMNPGQEVYAADAAISGGKAVCKFPNVAAGNYALAAFHAEKNERALEYGLFGKPRQGVGFSNNPSITFGAPSFEKARFGINKPTTLDIRLQY